SAVQHSRVQHSTVQQLASCKANRGRVSKQAASQPSQLANVRAGIVNFPPPSPFAIPICPSLRASQEESVPSVSGGGVGSASSVNSVSSVSSASVSTVNSPSSVRSPVPAHLDVAAPPPAACLIYPSIACGGLDRHVGASAVMGGVGAPSGERTGEAGGMRWIGPDEAGWGYGDGECRSWQGAQ
ncbi:hypothetical protein V496_10257, partial [Pseudogymnoascus sp. VKM F-4515 (FW-2607)]